MRPWYYISHIIVLLLCVAKSEPREIIDYQTQSLLNCYIRHLKTLNQIEADYPAHHTRNTITDCELRIKNIKTEMFKSVKTSLKKGRKTSQHTDCIVDYLKLEFWAEIQMKFAIYEASQSLSHDDKKKRTDELRILSANETQLAIKFCLHENELGMLYDNFYDNEGDVDDNKVVNFCTKKFVIENHLFNVALDPAAIASAEDCKTIIEVITRDIEEALIENLREEKPDVSDEQIECTLEKYRSGKYTQKLIETSVIAKIKLSEKDKAIRRRNFIKFVASIIHEVTKCFQNL